MALYPQLIDQIISKLDFYDILNIQKCNKLFYGIGEKNIKKIPSKYNKILTNKILSKYLYLEELNLRENVNITLDGILHLKNLIKLEIKSEFKIIDSDYNLDIRLLKELPNLNHIKIQSLTWTGFVTVGLLINEIKRNNLSIIVEVDDDDDEEVRYHGDFVFNDTKEDKYYINHVIYDYDTLYPSSIIRTEDMKRYSGNDKFCPKK